MDIYIECKYLYASYNANRYRISNKAPLSTVKPVMLMWTLDNKDTCIIHTLSQAHKWYVLYHVKLPEQLDNLDTFN